MIPIVLLTNTVGLPICRFLLKHYLGEPTSGVGDGLLEIAGKKIKSFADQREAERQFQHIADRVITAILPLFEQAGKEQHINLEAVASALGRTLDGQISAEFFVTRDLEPARLAAELRRVRPLPTGQYSEAETALYERALDQAVRYVVGVVSQLPRFEETLATESLGRLSRIQGDIDQLIDGIARIEQGVKRLWQRAESADDEARQRAERYEKDYREAVIRNLDYVELFGADLLPESRRQALSVAYVSLNVQQKAAKGGTTESLPAELVLASLRAGAGRLLVRGDAGSGKSTLFRWAALEAAGLRMATWQYDAYPEVLFALGLASAKSTPPLPNMFRDDEGQMLGRELDVTSVLGSYTSMVPLWVTTRSSILATRTTLSGDTHYASERGWRDRIPFLLRLRDCTGGKLPGPDEFPLHIAKELGSPPLEWVTSVLRDGRALVLLDGVDEVPNVQREEMRRDIEAIVGAYPDSYYLLSTRPAAVDPDWLVGLGFREASIDPMSDEDRAQFIRKWHEAVRRELARLGRTDPALPSMADELIEKLGNTPSVARLATNPLLCAVICALHRERHQKLPESQSEVCEAICQILLHRRERETGVKVSDFPKPYSELTYPQKRRIVQEMAYHMALNGESAVARDRAQYWIAAALTYIPGRSASDAEEVLQILIERSGLLRESQPGEIEFIHNTIKEFLAGERFAAESDLGLLVDRCMDPAWQPVVLFAAGIDEPKFASELIRKILDASPSVAAAELRRRRLLALRCRAMAVYLEPDVEARFAMFERGMFPPRTMGDAEALSWAGDAIIRYLHYRKNLTAQQAAACVRTLRLIGTSRARDCLNGYLGETRQAVVHELAQVFKPFDIPAVKEWIRRGEALPAGISRKVYDLRPLAEMTGLEKLNLTGMQVSDLAPLAGLTGLKWLILDGMQVSDVSPLAGLTKLETLQLWTTQVSDLAPLAGLTSLRALALGGTQVSDLAPLAGLAELAVLFLGRTQVSNLSPLANLAELVSFWLLGEPVTDLSPLAGLVKLKELHLDGTPVTDVSPLAGLTGLHKLGLSGTQVKDLSPLAALTGLEELYISDTRIVDASPLAPLQGLKVIMSPE